MQKAKGPDARVQEFVELPQSYINMQVGQLHAELLPNPGCGAVMSCKGPHRLCSKHVWCRLRRHDVGNQLDVCLGVCASAQACWCIVPCVMLCLWLCMHHAHKQVCCVQAQGLIRRAAKLSERQQKQDRICVRFYGALVLQGGCWFCATAHTPGYVISDNIPAHRWLCWSV